MIIRAMAKRDPRIDAYIENAAPFARPILRRLRTLVHRGCPEAVEGLKWGMPHFDYRGIFCGMAAFKAHCTFGFWNRAMNVGEKKDAMGQFGRITALDDLPPDATIVGYVKEAKRLADEGIRLGRVRKERKPLPVPPALTAALKKKSGALGRFRAMSPSQQRDYSEWIGEAKTEATRDRRIATAVDWIAQGKSRNWKYQPK
jgi:hypothetical protein